jgi:hypothetical protein
MQLMVLGAVGCRLLETAGLAAAWHAPGTVQCCILRTPYSTAGGAVVQAGWLVEGAWWVGSRRHSSMPVVDPHPLSSGSDLAPASRPACCVSLSVWFTGHVPACTPGFTLCVYCVSQPGRLIGLYPCQPNLCYRSCNDGSMLCVRVSTVLP